MRTNFYIDGFNLYYRALNGTQFKWLDLRKLAETLFPEDTIGLISYFTALIQPRLNNPGQPQRQQAYLRALNTLPKFEIFYGVFRQRTITRPLVDPIPGLPDRVAVRDMEEKGTDVNLAMRLLVDGFDSGYEQAVVVSNDSDLAGPIRYVRDELGLRVTVVNPDYRKPAQRDLVAAATRIWRLGRIHLRDSQFPPEIEDEQGTITKPAGW